jgi:2'-5' RNA ligase
MLPEQFTDRRQHRLGAPDFSDSVCWHLLLGDAEPVQKIATQAQQRLAGFTDLHMTPPRWLHATVLLAGRAADLTQADLDQMLTKARLKLNGTAPQTVTLGRVIYHPEGIVLPISPASALTPIFEAARATTLEVTGTPGATSTPGPSWHPHVTLCYSTSQQPAAPIIAALGKTLPPREVTIDTLTLVIQHGPPLSWDWRPVGAAHLGQCNGIEPASYLGEGSTLYVSVAQTGGASPLSATSRPGHCAPPRHLTLSGM